MVPRFNQFVAAAVAAVDTLAVGFFIQALFASAPPVLRRFGTPERAAKP